MLFYLSLLETEEDKSKFELIYYEYKNIMYNLAKIIIKNEAEAEDIVSDSFVKIIKTFKTIGEPVCNKTKNTVLIITRRTAIDLIRKKKNKKIISLDYDIETIPAKYISENFPEISELPKAMAMLPVKYRDILLLKFDTGYSDDEIAEIFGMSLANVKKTTQRAKKKLATIIQQMEVEV